MATYTLTFSVAGTYEWDAPPTTTSATFKATGAGSGGSSDPAGSNTPGGGGAGEYASETWSVTPGDAYTLTVGAGGVGGGPGSVSATSGGSTTVAGPAGTITANGGAHGTLSAGGTGGTGSGNTVHYNGGPGGVGFTASGFGAGSSSAGGGGASSAGPSSAGTSGSAATAPRSPGAGGTPVTGGGAGGGGSYGAAATAGSRPGGAGGGGGCFAGVQQAAGSGADGQVIVTFTCTDTNPDTKRRVELLLGDTWTDVTSDVYRRDQINITRGRSDESSSAEPQTCTFTLNNRLGKYTPSNPTGPYFGLIGRNTPVRVSVAYAGKRYFRFYGELSAWPLTWDQSGNDVYAQVTVSGQWRRIQQGTKAADSSLAQYMTEILPLAGGTLHAYWPMEDLAGASTIAQRVPGQNAMQISGNAQLANFTGCYGSDPLPVMGSSGSFTAKVAPYVPNGETSVQFLLYTTGLPASYNRIIGITTTSIAYNWNVGIDSTGGLYLRVWTFGGQVYDSGGIAFNIKPNEMYIVQVRFQDIGGTECTYTITTFSFNTGATTTNTGVLSTYSATVTGYTLDTIQDITVAPDSGSLTDFTIGHLAIYSGLTTFGPDCEQAAIAWAGENPSARFYRLCYLRGITYYIHSTAAVVADTQGMGWQVPQQFSQLLTDCVTTDGGIFCEPAGGLGLAMRPRTSLYNQAAAFTLDYSAHDLSGAPVPTDDDRYIQNDVTVSRDQGGSVEAVQTTGPMSVSDPPAGIGEYQSSPTLSLASDTQLGDQAGWALHVGTTSSSRYPTLPVDIRKLWADGDATMVDAILSSDIGDRVALVNPPSWLPPDSADQLMQGYSETISNYEHDIVYNCSPETPYRVTVVGTSHVDTDGSTLHANISATAATMQVDTTNGNSPLWTTSGADVPFDVSVSPIAGGRSGERMTVTGISGSTSPQTFTVTRSVNGVAMTHVAGENVQLWAPPILALG